MTDNVSNADESEFKEWVREYRKIDIEIRDATKLLGAMRKRRTQLDAAILKWMQEQKIPSIKIGEDSLGRYVKTSIKGVNQDRVTSILQSELDNEDLANALVKKIYEDREEDESEVLKIAKAQKKRKTLRPVEEDDE